MSEYGVFEKYNAELELMEDKLAFDILDKFVNQNITEETISYINKCSIESLNKSHIIKNSLGLNLDSNQLNKLGLLLDAIIKNEVEKQHKEIYKKEYLGTFFTAKEINEERDKLYRELDLKFGSRQNENSSFYDEKDSNKNSSKEIEYCSNCQKCNLYNEYVEKSSNYICYNCK